MKHYPMGQRKDKPVPVKPAREREADAEAPFDLWLKQGLHKLYDQVMGEPVPEELLRIIEENRRK